MPCFKKENGRRTPTNLRYIIDNELEQIEKHWRIFKTKRFPKSVAGSDVAGICVAQLDGTVSGCISTSLSMGVKEEILDPDRISILSNSIPDLETVICELTGDAVDYFNELLWLVREVLIRCTDDLSTKCK